MCRRVTPEKQEKDKQSALNVLHALIDKREHDLLKNAFNAMPRGWQARVKRQLTDLLDRKILDALRT